MAEEHFTMKCFLLHLLLVTVVGTNSVCPPRNLTEEQKVDLVAINGNHDNNSLVTTSDMVYSLLHNFDKNFDGEATPEEFETRWTCAYGDSQFFARYVFNQFAHGQPGITPSMLSGPPYDKGLTVEDFKNHIQQYYRTFQSRGCVNTDLRLDQQLDLIIADNDYNNDSRVTVADFLHDRASNYDADGDGYITFAEAVTAWTCNYGFPVGYGIYFAQEVIGAEGYNISTESYDPVFDTDGISVDELRTRNLKRYLNYYHLELAKGRCTPSTITREEMLVLNAAGNDFNNDLLVKSTDITFDVSENYDLNKDGRVTEDEWVARWTCAYGDTPFEARYMFNQISLGEDSFGVTDFGGAPLDKGISVEAFMSGNRKTFKAFVSEGCLNSDLSLDRKLDLVVSRVDSDENGIVSPSDLKNFFSTTYDTDNDGSVNRTEFVLRQGCAFGASAGLSHYLWSKINPQGKEAIQITQVSQLLNDTDWPVAEFRNLISKLHYEFAAQQVRNGACLPPATPVEERLVVNAVIDDVDGNGAITASDVSNDLSHTYDTNGDGMVTEEEWLTRRGCAFGETIYLSRYMFNYISNGEVQIGTSAEFYDRPPFSGAGFPLPDVNNLHRWLTSNFTAKCLNIDITLARKLDILITDADNDMNGFVTTADRHIEHGRYDANNDGNVSKAEFVSRWTCIYGDTVRFANFVWKDISPSGDELQVVSVVAPPRYNETGEPVADFRNTSRVRYLRYARQQLSSGTCAPKTLDVEDKLILNAVAVDFDQNAMVSRGDIANDLRANYDKNHDDRVSEEEWVTTWTCMYGDSPFYASFMFAALTDLEFLYADLLPNNVRFIDDFVAENRERYEQFRRNRCVTTQLSLEQKLDRIVSDNDFNKDGLVTTEDLNYDLSNRYDNDGDGNVTLSEWRRRWTCGYGDTASFALFVWSQLVPEGVASIPNTYFQANELFVKGVPVASFRTRNRQRYEAFEQRGGIVGR